MSFSMPLDLFLIAILVFKMRLKLFMRTIEVLNRI